MAVGRGENQLRENDLDCGRASTPQASQAVLQFANVLGCERETANGSEMAKGKVGSDSWLPRKCVFSGGIKSRGFRTVPRP